ncbi:MAG: hypothetical protein JWN33_51 [Candidatus Saccharibacteria bacterium]|nr:hypothetical protein [Candidatus Saccharibacteria bacterium]
MKKTIQTLLLAILGFTTLVVASNVSAVSTCQIGYTGPDSNNKCVAETTYTCSIKNTNTVTIDNDNTQVAVSGNTESSGSTGGGLAQTGSATNTNGVTYNVTVTNNDVCKAVATVPATETPTPGQGGAGSVQGVSVTAPAKTTPTVLANTSSDWSLANLAVIAGLVTAGVLVIRSVVAVYSRQQR